MRDLRIGAALAVTFASLLAASIAFAQQPGAQTPASQNPTQSPTPQKPTQSLNPENPAQQLPAKNPAQVGEDPPAVPGQAARLFKQADDLISAKESPIKAENDKRFWLDRGTALSDEQKQKIHQAVASRGENRIPASPDLYAEVSAVLPSWVALNELSDELRAEIPYIRNFKVVLTENKVLLIDPVGRVVATVIDERSKDEIKK